MNAALKREIERHEPQIWQGRASVELVHDLNNPLTVVVGYAALMIEEARAVAASDPERGKRLREYAGIVEKAAEYCHHLSENWRLASKQATEFSKLDLVQVVQEVRHVVFFGEIAVQFSGLSSASIRGSKFELMRVFQNVFKNALEAGAKQITVAIQRNGDRIELTVTDNGSGMDAEHARKALKGGFSNKINGTGLGLSICRHLLGTHGATMELQSAPGKGTTVRMDFPAAA
jgi:signal transduction histidine kinase